MGIQRKADREKISRLRQALLHLADEIKGLVEPFFVDRPVIKGTVYELKRRCGKPGCKCARGELHARMVVSASEGGKTRLQVIPRGFLVEVEVKVGRYQGLRRVRGRFLPVYQSRGIPGPVGRDLPHAEEEGGGSSVVLCGRQSFHAAS